MYKSFDGPGKHIYKNIVLNFFLRLMSNKVVNTKKLRLLTCFVGTTAVFSERKEKT